MALKVLIIEDDPSMTEFLEILLQRNGMDVFSSAKAYHGIEMGKTIHPDIVIVDLLLPGANGWEVCRAIRSFTKAPILVLSSLDDPDLVTSALDAGADEYITKPVSNQILLAHINNLIRRYAVENNLSSLLGNTKLLGNKAKNTNSV